MTSQQSEIKVRDDDPTPPYEQIRRQIVSAITAGDLNEGTRLPPVRQLAGDLAVSPGTVARAYRELETGGFVITRRGGGTRVAAGHATRTDKPTPAHTTVFVYGVLQHGGEILVVQRKADTTEYWDLPGMQLSWGDEPHLAIKQAFSAQTGLIVTQAVPHEVQSDNLQHAQHREHCIYITYTITSETPDPRALTQARPALLWVHKNAANTQMKPYVRRALEHLNEG